jgi:catalase-peroxidase
VLSRDFFTHLLDMGLEWRPADGDGQVFTGHDRASGALRWTATRVDLVFASNAQLRAQAEFYAEDGKDEKFVRDFVRAWTKVMNLDRFDLNWW